MPRKKLKHIQQCFTLPNVITQTQRISAHPGQDTVLELGCGRSGYTLALAARSPQQHFFGIDRKPDRIWVAASTALEKKLANANFIVSEVGQLGEFFPAHSITSIWLPFPDPQPRTKYAKRRLIALNYLVLYQHLLKPSGQIHLKTDNVNLITEAQANISILKGTIHQMNENFIDDVSTPYEQHYRSLGQAIYYLCFSV